MPGRNAGQDPALQGLDVYVVGGAVRDQLLGLPAGDRDWVVVGGTPEDMAARGFLPVGGDFPVFLHPVSKEEFALARTERKSGRGYKGFTFYTGPEVRLEEDLRRRDLTVNAIAQAPDGRLFDPWDGRRDIKQRVLRHVGEAFAEDPVRLLRLARFAARFGDFSIASETMALSRRLVAEGEVDALVPERVWREVAKGLMTDHPVKMFEVLEQAGALTRVMPGLVFDEDIATQLTQAAQRGLALPQRFALLCRKSDEPEQIGRHVRAPSECIDYARLLPGLVEALRGRDANSPEEGELSAGVPGTQEAWLDLIERNDGLRKPQRFIELLETAECVIAVDVATWQARLDAVRSLDAGAIAKSTSGKPEEIKAALRRARLEALSGGV